jgi:SHS family lactate transporter-like MFS transporter
MVDMAYNPAFIPLWIIPDTFPKLAAGAFCVQFGVQGAWGVVSPIFASRRSSELADVEQIPIFLAELSPPAFRATFPGVAYQLGNVSLKLFWPCLTFHELCGYP